MRIGFIFLILVSGIFPAYADLDFDKEIRRQERHLTVRYHKGRSTTYLPIQYYRFCRKFRKNPKTYRSCNAALEKKRYAAWVSYWKRQNAVVGQGELDVKLIQRTSAGVKPPVASK